MERPRPSRSLPEVRAELASLTGGGPISHTFAEVQQHVTDFQEERPLMKEYNTPVKMAEWLREETAELLAEINWGETEPTKEQITKVQAELADVVIFSLNLGQILGINVEGAITDKIAHNNTRFPKELFQDPTQDFEKVYTKRKIELGERKPTPDPQIPYGLIQERDRWLKLFP